MYKIKWTEYNKYIECRETIECNNKSHCIISVQAMLSKLNAPMTVLISKQESKIITKSKQMFKQKIQ